MRMKNGSLMNEQELLDILNEKKEDPRVRIWYVGDPKAKPAASGVAERFFSGEDDADALFDAIELELLARERAFESVNAANYDDYVFAEQTGVAFYTWLPRLYILISDPAEKLVNSLSSERLLKLQMYYRVAALYGVHAFFLPYTIAGYTYEEFLALPIEEIAGILKERGSAGKARQSDTVRVDPVKEGVMKAAAAVKADPKAPTRPFDALDKKLSGDPTKPFKAVKTKNE